MDLFEELSMLTMRVITRSLFSQDTDREHGETVHVALATLSDEFDASVLGVTRLPPWFGQAFTAFEPVFADSRNLDSFKHLVSALILAETQWTVSRLTRGISRPDKDARS